MEQSEIIRMAREAGDWNGQTAEFNDVGLERFAALVAAHEREKRTKELMQLFLDPENQPGSAGAGNHIPRFDGDHPVPDVSLAARVGARST